MTEEDQLLVAKAALAGVRFSRSRSRYWQTQFHTGGGNYTIGRAAAVALKRAGLITEEEHRDYFDRTSNIIGPVDVDISALAGCQLEVAKAEEPTP